jgi:PAS domain S-box-containing protein
MPKELTPKQIEALQALSQQVVAQLEVRRTAQKLAQTNKDLESEIVERKRIELKLREQAQLLEISHDAIIVRNLEGKILFWNKGAEQIYGYSREDALGKITHTLLETQFPVSLEDVAENLIDKGEWEGELQHKRRDGSRIILDSRQVIQRDSNGNPLAVLEINSDITDRKQAEEALYSAERYHHLFTHATDAIIVFEFETGNIIDVNERACELYDTARDSFIGKRFKSLFQNSEQGDDYIDDLQTKGLVRDFEVTHLRSDGAPVSLMISSSINDYRGQKAVLNIGHDITERKLAEEQLRKAEEQLRRLIEGVKDYAIFMLDTEGRVITWNTGAERIKGYRRRDYRSALLAFLS